MEEPERYFNNIMVMITVALWSEASFLDSWVKGSRVRISLNELMFLVFVCCAVVWR
jgi:hypothetical protein